MSQSSKKKSSQQKPIQQQKKDSVYLPKNILLKVGIAFASITIIRIIASFFPNERVWGLNHFAFLPLWISILIAVLSILFCTPIFYRVFQSIASGIFGSRKKIVAPFLFGVIAIIIFWSFRMDTFFLGDGATYLAELYRLSNHVPYSEEVLYSTHSAPLTGWIHATMRKIIDGTSLAKKNPFNNTRISFWITGIVLGVLFVLLSLKIARELSSGVHEKLWIFISLLSSAGLIFYFGYVEYYTFVFSALALYFYLCIRVIENKIGIFPLVLSFIFAVASHLMALVALPSLLLVILYRSHTPKIQTIVKVKNIIAFIVIIFAGAGIFYFASGIYKNGSRTLISLLSFGNDEVTQSYTLLSPYHLIDFINLILLYSAPILITAVLIFKKEYLSKPEVIIASVNLFFFGCLALFGYPCFGLARDWDINAALGLAFLFFSITIMRQSKDSSVRKYILYIASGAALLSIIPWLIVNINHSSSVDRYRSIVALDEAHIPGDFALNGYEHLSKWYKSVHDDRSEIWAMKKKIECVGYPSDYRALALKIYEGIPNTERKNFYDWIFESLFSRLSRMNANRIDSSYAGTRFQFEEIVSENIIQCFHQPEQDGLGENYAKEKFTRAETLMSQNPVLDIVRAEFDLKSNPSIIPKEKFLHGGKANRSSNLLSIYAGKGLILANDMSDAKEILERGYHFDTTATLSLFHLAYIESQLTHDYAKIKTYLEKFLSDPKTERMKRGTQNEQLIVQYAEKMLTNIK